MQGIEIDQGKVTENVSQTIRSNLNARNNLEARRKARLEQYYGITAEKDQYITANNSLSETEKGENNLSVATP